MLVTPPGDAPDLARVLVRELRREQDLGHTPLLLRHLVRLRRDGLLQQRRHGARRPQAHGRALVQHLHQPLDQHRPADEK